MTSVSPNAKVERLLALILIDCMKGEPAGAKSEALSRVGFTNAEIGEMIGTTPQVVKQLLYLARKSKTRKSTRRRTARR